MAIEEVGPGGRGHARERERDERCRTRCQAGRGVPIASPGEDSYGEHGFEIDGRASGSSTLATELGRLAEALYAEYPHRREDRPKALEILDIGRVDLVSPKRRRSHHDCVGRARTWTT